jgi:hypothetical protein
MKAFVAFQARAEAEAGKKLGTLRTNRGGEFTACSFVDHCAKEGIQRHLTAPYSPEQNGVVERRNQTVMGMARSMLKAMKMPGWFWGEAVVTAVYVLNRSPTQSVEGRTPYEVWHGSKLSVHHFRTFGCVAHVKQGSKRLSKLEDHSTPMVFIGYEPGSKAWRFYDPTPSVLMCHATPCSRRIGHGTGATSSKVRWVVTGSHSPLSTSPSTVHALSPEMHRPRRRVPLGRRHR